MQVLVTFQLSGESEEVATTLAAISAVLPPVGSEALTVEGTAWWTPERANEMVHQITDNARKALTVICTNAPQVPFDAVLDTLGMDGISTGGVMASIGFALKNMGAPQFLARNYSRRMYIIDTDVASTFLGALQRRGA